MGKKLPPINTNAGPLASGFFSPETIHKAEKSEENSNQPVSNTVQTQSTAPKPKHAGGRPPKKTEEKRKNHSIGFYPHDFARIQDYADASSKSVSQLITDAVFEYIRNHPV